MKVMGYASGDEVDVVLCVPQKCAHVPNRAAYLENKQVVLAECGRLAKERLEDVPARSSSTYAISPSGTSCT